MFFFFFVLIELRLAATFGNSGEFEILERRGIARKKEGISVKLKCIYIYG